MKSQTPALALTALITSILAACGGGDSSSGTPAQSGSSSAPQSGNVSMIASDASTEDWATIGVKVISIALVPQSGGASVTVYTAGASPPVVNLAQLDQLGELLANVSVPVGTYSSAVLNVGGNPGDVLLNVAADPEAGFAGTPGTAIASSDIQIQHTQGAAPDLTVPVKVAFVAPLVVSANQNNQLDLEFDLSHPAFIVGHVPPGAGTTIWAVNFDGPVRHHPLPDLARLVLRHMYGTVASVAGDNSSITITREFPTEPVVTPETAITTTATAQILADATNGTLFYDVDAKTRTVIKDFSAESMLSGKSVRIAARYQADGTLVATRIWASSQFNNVWLSPEGHVLHVNAGTDVLTIENESGVGVPVVVNADTQFFFRTPQNAPAETTPIATGPSFLANHDIARGFKVHASVVDPLATPLVAQSVDIETAAYTGVISAANGMNFTYTRNFRTASDDYSAVFDYISASTANGMDDSGNAITGFKWWDFAYPTVLMSGTNAIADFVAATGGMVNFGGSIGAVPTRGTSYAVWNDPANPNGWAVAGNILTPSSVPLGVVATALTDNQFTMTVAGGTSAATIDVSSTSGGATLVYQVDRTNNVVSISSIDVSTSTGLSTLTNSLSVGALVKVYGVPQSDGSLKAYVLTYFTGDMPSE